MCPAKCFYTTEYIGEQFPISRVKHVETELVDIWVLHNELEQAASYIVRIHHGDSDRASTDAHVLQRSVSRCRGINVASFLIAIGKV
jgi:hypothetical protein